MKNIFHKIGAALILSSAFFFTGCEPEFENDITVSRGELNLSKYVAVGNSLTAGFQDNGLYLEGQVYSYPNILANQFSFAGGGAFVQPYFSEAQSNGSGYIRLAGISATGSPTLAPVTTNLAVRTDAQPLPGGPRLTKFADAAKVQNWGVPGISVLSSAYNEYGNVNPYFERLLTDAEVTAKTTYIQKVVATQPTFFSLWLGNNDVLTYATSGGVAVASNPFSNMTPVAQFQAIYQQLAGGLVQGGKAKGIVMNIPDVTSVPFFTTVTQASVRRSTGNDQLVIYIRDEAAPNGARPIADGDYILLTTQANLGRQDDVTLPSGTVKIPHGFHPANPLNDNEVLDKVEVAEIKTRTSELNAIIEQTAKSANLAFFDVHAYFNNIKSGFSMSGINYSPAFITGNLFSLDGVHLTPRGYAIIANEMITRINAHYKATIPTIDVTQFRAVLIP
ncbi:G-D-S-L family lipolytic protein [Rufibacter immobilis]|uniref:G-D-S-L family lipolytic protein n=1 Tax=Rufibacter immobilis TaxID=1348778 RepID=A0A3M9N3Q2_9BACT|nr:SGNH/GDSL hydrolase family protein [Rufibacter immobilis]RNI32431.1 G-D-S-L family lipolytic protein [Rufibacter immobilis]